MEIVTDTELLGLTLTTPQHVVEHGVLDHQGFTLITGQEGIGKSLLVMHLGTHIARGEPWLGFAVPAPQRVLLIQKELPTVALQARLRAQCPKPTGRFFVALDAYGVQFSSAGDPTIIDTLIAHCKPQVLVLDPLTEFGVPDENDAAIVRQVVLKPIERWRSAGLAVIVVHHHGKPNAESPRSGTAKVRGSSALTASCDTNLQLAYDDKTKGWLHIEFAKLRNHPPRKRVPILLDPTNGTFRLRSQADAVLAAIEAQGGDVSVSDLTAQLGSGQSTTYRAVARLVEEGKLEEYQTHDGKEGRPKNRVRITSPEKNSSPLDSQG